MSFLLVVLIAISLGSVSAEDASDVALEADDAVDVIAADEPITPASDSVADVQTAVDTASAGNTVDLSKYAEYDFTNNTVTIKNDGIIVDGKGTTTIKGYGDGSGIFAITAKNVTIQGIKFIDTNPKNDFKYNGTTAGWGISASAANGGLVKDCEFTDFNSGIVVMQTTGFNIEGNKFNGGYTTQLLNDPTVNKEQGSKSLNIYRQSSAVVVKNNTFEGPILDGVSIAQGSGANQVIGNTFIENCYAIYFGGASTKGSLISNNTFINCGKFEEGDIFWDALPVISIQKASDGIAVQDNTFQVINNNVLIAAESGNEAHGFPTTIGDINVTGNIVTKFADDVDASTVTLFHVLVREASSLDISAPVNVTNNVLEDGVKGVSVWFVDKEILSVKEAVLTTSVAPVSYLFNTSIEAKDISVAAGDNGKLQVTLKDSNGNPLANKELSVVIDGKIQSVTTNSLGVATLNVKYANAATKYATIVYAGEGSNYQSSLATAKITVTKKATTLTAAKTKVTGKVKKAIKIKVTLKTGKTALKSKKVTIKVNGKTFSGTTNAKGQVTITVKVTKKGTYKAVFKFAGDGAYKASSSKTVKFTVKK